MKKIALELAGQKFGKLLVIKRVENKIYSNHPQSMWLCKCDCGKEHITTGSRLKTGHATSCGCKFHSNNIKNIIGQKFGKLTVIKRVENKIYSNGNIYSNWLCKCSCGNEIIVIGVSLRNGNTTSCGCPSKYNNKIIAGKNYLYKNYKRGAINRGLNFKLTYNQFIDFISDNCYYCGIGPRQTNKSINFMYNGIDRVNNNLGYEIGNVVTCCKICNHAKVNLSLEEFKSWVNRCYNNLYCGDIKNEFKLISLAS